MKPSLLVVAAAALLVVLPAAAKQKRPIELDAGAYRWSRFSYSELTPAQKSQLRGAAIVNRLGGAYVEYDHETLSYDGDSTLVRDHRLRVVMAAESVPPRFPIARVDPGLGETLEVRRIVLQRKGRPDVEYRDEDLVEEASGSWFGYHDSDRVYSVELPQDEADATLDVEIRITTHSHPGFEGMVQAAVLLQSIALCQERSITFRYPREHPLYLYTRGFDVELKPRRDGDHEVVTLTLEELYPIYEERWSASPLARFPAFLVSSVEDWDAVHARAAPVFEERMVPDDALRAEVARLTEGLDGERARAEAIFRFVTTELHYLGLYEGESGWVPHPATQVLASRFGDCKDHTVLLAAMLREAGIDAWPALIRAGRMGFTDATFPFVNANHAIVYATVGGEGLFLDGTGSPFSFDEPPDVIRDRTAVVIGEAGMELVDTPRATGAGTTCREHTQLHVDEDGVLAARIELTYGGSLAVSARERFRRQTREEIDRGDRAWVARHVPLAEEVAVEQEDDPASETGPLTRTLSLHSRSHVRRMGPVMLLELPALEAPPPLAPLANAHEFEVWVTPLSYELELEVVLPPGYEVVELPDDRRTIRPFGRIEAEFEQAGSTVHVAVSGTWNSARVAPAAAETYAQFLTELSGLLEQRLVLVERGAR